MRVYVRLTRGWGVSMNLWVLLLLSPVILLAWTIQFTWWLLLLCGAGVVAIVEAATRRRAPTR